MFGPKPDWVGQTVIEHSAARAHEKSLELIAKYGESIEVIVHERVPGGHALKYVKTKELTFLNVVITNPLDPSISKKSEWTSQEAIREYANKEIIGKVIPEGFTYTYGNDLQEPVDQIARCVEMLKEDMSSRKATMKLGDPRITLWATDPECCVIVDLKVRKGRLFESLVFRSHDYGGAAYANWRAFGMLQQEIANKLGVGVGTLNCTSYSAHVYEHDFSKLED